MVKKIGTRLADTLTGTAGNDELNGLGGDDVLFGLAGNDTILGGEGNDRLYGNDDNDILQGMADNDRLDAGRGSDSVFGGEGNDEIIAIDDGSSDYFSGGFGTDTINYSLSLSAVTVDLAANLGQRGAAGDTYLSIENVIGTRFDDVLKAGLNGLASGLAGNDSLTAGSGNATLSGGTGRDTLTGGAGNDMLKPGTDTDVDHIFGGGGIDTVNYSECTSALTAYLKSNVSSGGAAGDIYGTDVENVIGSQFNDFLQCGLNGTAFGGNGDDVLYGAFGADKLRGDGGRDTLRMDYGETQAWLQNNQSADVIQYFVEDSDKLFIDLSEFNLGTTFDSSEIINSNSVTAFGTNAQFIYEDDAKNLWFDSNGTDAGGLLLIATFENATIANNNLGTNDFDFRL